MALLNPKMQMTVINPSATIVEIENEPVIAAEIATEIESEEIAAGTRFAERQMEIKMEHLQVITGVHMEVQRVGAEAEVEMMTADTHVATETVLTRPAAEMEITTEEVAACAHGLGARTEISTVLEIVVIAMMQTLLQEKTAETEMTVAKAEAPNERVHLH
jgi:hypothetical protein